MAASGLVAGGARQVAGTPTCRTGVIPLRPAVARLSGAARRSLWSLGCLTLPVRMRPGYVSPFRAVSSPAAR